MKGPLGPLGFAKESGVLHPDRRLGKAFLGLFQMSVGDLQHRLSV